MTFLEFQARFFEAMTHLQEAMGNHLSGEIDYDPEPLKDPEELRTVVRKAAQEVMLATDARAEMERLVAEDPRVPFLIYAMYESIDLMSLAVMMKRVHAAAPADSDALPLYPFSAFFLQACEQMRVTPEPAKKPRPKTAAKKTPSARRKKT